MLHRCLIEFSTKKIDDCTGIGTNLCHGTGPMIFEAWYQDKDGCESYFDNWVELEVNYCPFCGLKSLTSYHKGSDAS